MATAAPPTPRRAPPAQPPAAARFAALEESDRGRALRFEVRDVDLSVVNAVRRALISDVPTAAFCFDAYNPANNGVLIRANTTSLHNEFIGHRISLLPIGFDENQLRIFEPSHYRFELRAKNETPEPLNVTTADIAVYDHTGARYPREAVQALFPPDPVTGDHVLIMRLRPAAYTSDGGSVGEELHAECTATLGTGSRHARWSPVSGCYFRNKHDPAASEAALAARLAGMRAAGATPEVVGAEAAGWGALEAHRHFVRNADGDPAAFEFYLRSEAPRMRPAYLVFKALSVLQGKLLDAARALRGGDGEARISVQAVPNMDDFYAVSISGEGHTLGNLVQAMLFRKWVDAGKGADVRFIGYYVPHPLEDVVVFKVQCTAPDDNVRERLAGGMDWVREHLAALAAEWVAVAGLARAGIVEVNEAVRKTAAKAARGGP